MNNDKTEGSAWFWRVFGSTMIGLVSVPLFSIFSYFNASINDLKSETSKNIDAVSSMKERITNIEQNKESIRQLWRDLSEIKQKVAQLESLKDRATNLERDIKDVNKSLQDIKEKLILIDKDKKGIH